MSIMTPMNRSEAYLLIATDGETLSVFLDDGHGGYAREIAWSAPDSNPEDFKWLVRGCAAFHNIPVFHNIPARDET